MINPTVTTGAKLNNGSSSYQPYRYTSIMCGSAVNRKPKRKSKKNRKIIIDFPIDSVKDQPCTNYKKEIYTGDITDDNILERKNEIKSFRRG